MNEKVDIRYSDIHIEKREIGDETPMVIRGYALKFDKPSEDLGFIEYLDRRCLDNTNMDNVVALLNHDKNYVLARTGRNLSLGVDDTGLWFEFEPNNTSYVRDLIENINSGLINKCSFAFSVRDDGDSWEKREDGKYIRTIRSIDRLYDVSIVTTPAYNDTEALLSSRSLDSMKQFESKREREIELMQMELEL
ncbi:HK97 family phage prohead protease [Aerococcaceae bacterium zg-ZJ1578]|uniref:HK97 family phage prohead protease n=1 Tax=Aerococcaceae bacterium zg-252 TaxID=2796928 RepID=UPI001A2DDB21|nr:HK97 family phage prohead protease [Aerococcaceae bacterium zg-1578]